MPSIRHISTLKVYFHPEVRFLQRAVLPKRAFSTQRFIHDRKVDFLQVPCNLHLISEEDLSLSFPLVTVALRDSKYFRIRFNEFIRVNES